MTMTINPRPIEAHMTVRGLRDHLEAIIDQMPTIKDKPVIMYADAEGNGVHNLREIYIDVETEGAPPLGVLLVPTHDRTPGYGY